jgi:orotate phosphoribosyltransferase
MDANLITAIVTAVATAGSSTTIAIVAILQTNKRIDDIAARLDRMDRRLEAIEQHLGVFVVDIAR